MWNINAIHKDVNESLKKIEHWVDVLAENQGKITQNQDKIARQLKIITDSMKKSKK